MSVSDKNESKPKVDIKSVKEQEPKKRGRKPKENKPVENKKVDEAPKKEVQPTKWMKHVLETKESNPGKSYKEVLKMSKLSYKK